MTQQMQLCRIKRNKMGAVESVEKAEIFPHFPQQTATTTRKSGGGSKKKSCSEGRTAIAVQTDTVEKGGEKEYNQAAAGKEGYSKQGSRGTCSGLTK